MPVNNNDIAEIFKETADFLEIKGENHFRVRAYRNAARTIDGLSRNLSDMIGEGEDLTELPAIGKDLAGKIEEIIESGKLTVLDNLKKEIPPELGSLMNIQGLGARRVKALYDELDITSIDDLKKAAESHRIRDIEGFGEKTEESIFKGIGRISDAEDRKKISAAEKIIEPLYLYLKETEGVKDIVVAGSNRRKKETVRDVDILVSVKKGSNIMDRFVNYEDVEKVIARGEKKSSVRLRSGFQADLRVVQEAGYGAALLYFTGSKSHNIALRKIAVNRDLKLNEYGVFHVGEIIAGKTEKEVYGELGLDYVEPELREDRGEVEAAQKGRLPELVTLDDIRGDLHSHTKRTDGKYTLEEMANAARDIGYEYLANTEHSRHVTVAGGLNEKQLAEQIREIDRLNEKLDGITILKSIEVDILEDGSLDLPDRILKELDFTVCSIHYKFNLSRGKQTERVIRAMDNPFFTILGHPTGRLINERPPYEIDMERVISAAAKRGCFLELDASPDRLDLNDIHCKAAKDTGVLISISTDAHSTDSLDFMRFGINQARRGWLEAGDVLNTRSLDELRKLIKR